MYHLRFKGNHYDMGSKRGKIFKKCNIVFPLNMDDFQMEHGIESEKILQRYFKEICEEIKGITDTIGVDYYKFVSWLLAMGCCMYNLENNFPLEIRGCTAFAINYKNNVYYGRNNDLPPYLKEGSKSEIYSPKGGNRFNITTSSFINGEEGINEKGLAVAMTFVGTKLEDIKPGFNSVFIVRYLLEKGNSVKNAKELLLDLPIASNCNILLADNSGDMIIFECTPDQKNIRQPIIVNDELSIICTVNSFISENMKTSEWCTEDDYRSLERYNNVINAFRDYKNEDLFEYIMDVLKGNKGFMCQYDKSLNFETVWSSIFHLESLIIYRAEGNPRRCKFICDDRLKKSCK